MCKCDTSITSFFFSILPSGSGIAIKCGSKTHQKLVSAVFQIFKNPIVRLSTHVSILFLASFGAVNGQPVKPQGSTAALAPRLAELQGVGDIGDYLQEGAEAFGCLG